MAKHPNPLPETERDIASQPKPQSPIEPTPEPNEDAEAGTNLGKIVWDRIGPMTIDPL